MSIPISLRHESWKTKHETELPVALIAVALKNLIPKLRTGTRYRYSKRVLEYLVVIKLKLVPYIDINESKFSSSM